MNRQILSLIAVMVMCSVTAGNATGQAVIKLGTMAPEGSDWGKTLNQMNAELIEQSHGQLRFRLFWGMDERVLVDGIEEGLFDAISLTGGLGSVLSEAFILQLPMLFSTYEELDRVKAKLSPRFEQKLREEGYVLLGWVEFGFIYLFSTTPVRTQTDFQRTRFWAWDLDPIAKEFVSRSGGEPIVLPIKSVLSSLKKGEVQTVYSSPLACNALEWHTQVRYMSDLRLAAGVGATIVDRGKYDRLSNDHRLLLKEITGRHHEQLISTIRERNEESIYVLQQQGIEVIHVPLRERVQWSQVAREVQDQFAGTGRGKLYSRDLLDEVRTLLKQKNIKR